MSEFKLNEFTNAMASSKLTEQLSNLWKRENIAQRWDVASTGCVANITPILGYLWLMVAATENHEIYVTKLPSKGGSCGTVDILESGGLSFPTDAEAIVRECKKKRGVICQPTDALAPVDKVLMDARRATNLMTNFPFVYASILSKRIAIGCTHCIVDVKLGQATKMLSPWMDEEQLKLVRIDQIDKQTKEQILVIEDDYIIEEFKELLNQMVSEPTTSFKVPKGKQWIEQKCQEKSHTKEKPLRQLQEVRWLLTNSSMPQCRAIGRQLILIHIDELIKDEKTDDLLRRDDNNEYKKLYAKVLPEICGVSAPSWEKLRPQWQKLKVKLPKLESFAVANYLKDAKYSELQKSYGGEDGNDLRFITFGLYPYQLQAINPVTIQKMDAYELDKIFEWLCGENTYDPEVGIWLHKLPGEKVEKTINNEPNDEERKYYKKLEVCGLWEQAIVSIFYRPSRCSEAEVIAKARQFLCNVNVT